ncbi:MAG: hypothetical protein HFG53_01045 [Lachnospiraceae bacterium]|jgi:hypothetical protein|nr:hypothetical protein [Lachnospiraceae bacterium]
MEIRFIVLTILVFCFGLLLIYKNKIISSLTPFWILTFIHLYVPAFYYCLLKGNSYKKFNDIDLSLYMNISIISYSIFIISLLLKVRFPIHKKIIIKSKKSNQLVFIYMLIILFGVLAYTTRHFFEFPLVKAIYNRIIVERPDVSGNIPHYFTFSVFACWIVPCFYFYILEHYSITKLMNIFLLLSLGIFFTIGGNKSTLVYFFIFFWIFCLRMKVDFRLMFMGCVSFAVYFIMKGGLSGSLQLADLISSGVRRFIVTQAAMLINRFAMLRQGYVFSDYPAKDVYMFVYDMDNGSAPTYFIGDLIIKYGMGMALVLYIFILSFLFAISNKLDHHKVATKYQLWTFFSITYFLGQAGISKSNMYRPIAILLNYMILTFLENHQMRKEKSL